MTAIIVRPLYDDVTKTMNGWAARASKYIIVTDDLNGVLAIEPNLRLSLRTNSHAEVIAFYGHGHADYLLGQRSGTSAHPIIHVREPGVLPLELTKRCLYAVACSAGIGLGPALAASGCQFVGYDKKFCFAPGFEDDFEGVVNRGLITLVTDGSTSTQVLRQLREQWDTLTDETTIGSKSNRRNAFLAALSAHWNRSSVCSY